MSKKRPRLLKCSRIQTRLNGILIFTSSAYLILLVSGYLRLILKQLYTSHLKILSQRLAVYLQMLRILTVNVELTHFKHLNMLKIFSITSSSERSVLQNYLKENIFNNVFLQLKFIPCRYMDKQSELTCDMRAVLVDWLVEVQESFELNHETLYSAVRLVDLYLSHTTVNKENLQLVGTTAMLISSKFEVSVRELVLLFLQGFKIFLLFQERCPPCVDDFLYICDDAYTRRDLIRMEMSILKAINFDIGLPLSYSFLRRYARVSWVNHLNIYPVYKFVIRWARPVWRLWPLLGSFWRHP